MRSKLRKVVEGIQKGHFLHGEKPHNDEEFRRTGKGNNGKNNQGQMVISRVERWNNSSEEGSS